MKTKHYKRKTKNKRNKKTRRRGGATQSSKVTSSSLYNKFSSMFTPEQPEPELTAVQSFTKFGEASIGLVASGAESSASIIRGASIITKKLGVAIELAGHVSGKSSVRLVSTLSLGSNITFGTLSLVGQATTLLLVSTSKILKLLTRLFKENQNALQIIHMKCTEAKIAKNNTVGPVDTEECMRLYKKYLNGLIIDTTKNIKHLFAEMELTLKVKRVQVKSLMLAIGCTKPRRFMVGPKIYDCKNPSSVLVQVDPSGMYKYLPDGTIETGVKGKQITLVEEYTRLKKLESTLKYSHALKVAKFIQQANIVRVKVSKSQSSNPLKDIHEKIDVFQKIDHCEKFYAELVLEFETPFNMFCDLLLQILEHNEQKQFNKNNEKNIPTPEEIETIIDEKIIESEAQNSQNPLSEVYLTTQINQLLEEDELQNSESDEPVPFEELTNTVQLGDLRNTESVEPATSSNQTKLGGQSFLNGARRTHASFKKISQNVSRKLDPYFESVEAALWGSTTQNPQSFNPYGNTHIKGTFSPEIQQMRKQMEMEMAAYRYTNKPSDLTRMIDLNKRKNALLRSINNPTPPPVPSPPVPSPTVPSPPVPPPPVPSPTTKQVNNENEHLSKMYKMMQNQGDLSENKKNQ